ncbi:hypothetical protein C7374_11443 [Falsochrobactrum ovis]|uniref:Dcm methylase n=2 Tax=Falsochrobactrum ovis TaxID=1293442 RepID=A0A364JSR0_9HYPH|nr:hypothetical protein C7374_11443 [Falsochrobactrum ovis]
MGEIMKHDNDNARGLVILLCNLTNAMAEPWVEAGYDVLMVDPQHGMTHKDGRITRFAGTVLEAAPLLAHHIRHSNIVFVAGFPPCTDVAVSGARWWEDKRAKDPYFQAKAAIVAEQCRMTCLLSGAPGFFENPVSAFSRIFGPATHTFHPHDYTGYCASDNYVKRTCLWAFNDYRMPAPQRDQSLGKPDTRIWTAPPGPQRANIRSAFPRGFSVANFLANAPHLASTVLQDSKHAA